MPQQKAAKLFGTDGIRGKAGESPLDAETIRLIGRALIANIPAAQGDAPRLVIGRDTRESGPAIESALTRGALEAGASVESAGVITTPGVAYVTRSRSFDAGVVISASHNPYQDNGIKVFSPSGKKLADETEARIESDVARAIESPQPPEVLLRDAATIALREGEYQQAYLDFLASEIAAGLDLRGMRIGIDCANGAASALAPQLFRRLNASVDAINDAPDGRNINKDCGSLHLEALQRLVAENHLDLGIAFDGDADRALFVDEAGILVDGDATLLILATDLQSRGALARDTVVATVMSNIGLELALQKHGIALARSSVGDRYVLEELIARRASLGGEQSGHIIFPEISLAGDGMITAIELLRAVKRSGRSLHDLASQMTRFPQVLVNVRVGRKEPFERIPTLRAAIDRLENDLQGRGRLLVRYSGTENLARVMIEGRDQQQIEAQARELAELIKGALGAPSEP